MSANDEARLATLLFKGTVGLLMALSIALAGWALQRTVDHDGRIIRMETRQDNAEANYQDIKRELKDIKDLLIRKP